MRLFKKKVTEEDFDNNISSIATHYGILEHETKEDLKVLHEEVHRLRERVENLEKNQR